MANPVQKVPSRQNLRRNIGLVREFGFLELNTLDTVMWDDDFLGDTIEGGYQTAVNGTSAAALTITTTGIGGTATMVSGTSTEGDSAVALGLEFEGRLNAVIAARVKISDIADAKIEIGFTDAVADRGAVLVLDTTTFTATDAAVWCFDTDGTNDYWHAASTSNAHASADNWTLTNAGSTVVPVNDTYETLIVALEGTGTAACDVHFYRLNADGYQTYTTTHSGTGPNANIALTPWVYFQTRNGSDTKTMTVDYIKAWQRRTVS